MFEETSSVPYQGRWSVRLAAFISAAMVLSGLTFSGLYAFEVLRSLSGADRAVVFWALPVLMIGSGLTLMGAVLAWLAKRAARGDRELLSLVRALLIAFALIAVMAIGGIGIKRFF